MRSLLILVMLITITGCTKTKPIVPQFPSAPPILKQPCSDLTLYREESGLSDIVRTTTENYVKYHECAKIVDGWNQWYEYNKKLHGEAAKIKRK